MTVRPTFKWLQKTQSQAMKTVEIPSIIYRNLSSSVPSRGIAEQSVVNGPLGDFERYPCVKELPMFPKKKWSVTGRCVRTVGKTNYIIQYTNKCVQLKVLNGTVPICTYPADRDTLISENLQRSGDWEGYLVSNLVRYLRTRPDAEFLDVGCNIGVYTLAMAYIGTRVTAVDALLQNLQLLSQSLTMARLKDNVTLIWNAISNEHTLVALNKPLGNIGGTHIQDTISEIAINSKTHYSRTITLDDLIPLFMHKRLVIKMDIEGSEYNALLGGNLFFERIDILLIQMEFLFHKNGKVGKNIVEFLASKGFDPFMDLDMTMPLKSSDISKWITDVYFIKVRQP